MLLMSIEREHPRAAHQVAVDRFNHVSFADAASRRQAARLYRDDE